MDPQDRLLNKVSSKTHVSKEQIMNLVSDLQNKDLTSEKDIKEFVHKVSKVTQKDVTPAQMQKIVDVITHNKIPKDIDHLV